MYWNRTVSRIGLTALAFLAAGCSNDATDPVLAPPPPESPVPVPTKARLIGDGQTGVVGVPLAGEIGVKITDQAGAPVPGLTVGFAVIAGRGTLGSTSTSTNDEGEARTTLTLGTVAGWNDSVRMTVAGYPGLGRTISARALASPAAAVERISGDGQQTVAGESLPNRLYVRVTDRYTNPVSGAEVHWTVTAGGGTVSSLASSTTDGGLASVVWTVGVTPGADSQGLSATVAGLPASSAVSFLASAGPAPASLIKVSGDLQTAAWGQPLPQPMVIRVLDTAGMPVPGLKVSWGDRQDWMGGWRALSQATTNADGEASAALTLAAQDFWGPDDSVRVASATVHWGEGHSLETLFYVVNR